MKLVTRLLMSVLICLSLVSVAQAGWKKYAKVSTALEANGLALQPVLEGASDALLEKYVQPMTEEPRMAAYAVTEPGVGREPGDAGFRRVKAGQRQQDERAIGCKTTQRIVA